jgi:Mesyanzhinovviridae DNA helicase
MSSNAEFQPHSKLYQHQVTAVQKALANPNAFAYLCETGTGKTAAVLAEYQRRLSADEIDDLLVIAPAGCIRNWYMRKSDTEPSELEKHLDPRLYKELLIGTNRSNTRTVKYEALRDRMLQAVDRPRALFVNIESLSRKIPTVSEQWCQQFLSQNRCMIVVDEATTIRNHRSFRTKAVMRLGQLAVSRRILTGLVTPKSPLDLFAQFNFLNEGILNQSSYVAFRATYAKIKYVCKQPAYIVDRQLNIAAARRRFNVPPGLEYEEKVELTYNLGGYIPETIPILIGYQNLKDLQQKIQPYCYQVLKKDCLDLEPKIYVPRDIELTTEQARIYKEVKNTCMGELGNGSFVTAKSVLDRMIKLHQVVCGHVMNEQGSIQDISSGRINEIIDILHEHEGKAIIWTVYRHEVNKLIAGLSKEFGSKSVAAFWGGNIKERENEEIRWKNDPQCRFMISTPMSGGKGNTWNESNLVIYAANTFDLEHRFQSEDRCHRIGQKNKVTYIDLIARGTVEEKIIWALRNKIDLQKTITGEKYREWLV